MGLPKIMKDQYQQLAKYYDDLVQKNRDYQAIANHLAEIIGDNRNLLSIGIGTGLVVECLLEVEPRYNITGVDNSQSLLDIAKKKLGEKVNLHCQSVSDLNTACSLFN
ncbi:MAG: methyltransferase domain-containing protein [Hormoscilla sp. SP5CHS1]|nr:methyltransferase domain-containing protein [Hormoscilla sp. SP5CHS1]